MEVSEALTEIRNKINDRDEVGLDDEEILSYLNEAIQYIYNVLIGSRSPIIVEEMEITENEVNVPSNFAKFAGGFPIRRTNNRLVLLDEPPLKIRYFKTIPALEIDDDMPFDYYTLNQVAIKLACVYASNQQKLDVTTDKALLDEINTSIITALASD